MPHTTVATILNYDMPAGPIGATLKLASLETLADDAAALAELRAVLDDRLAVRISAKETMSPAALEKVTRFLGRVNENKGDSPMVVAELPIMANFSSPAKEDDGRPHVPALIEQLHNDVMANGPASYGVLHTRIVPSGVDMRFVDLRATYEALPAALREKLDGRTLPHFPRATKANPSPEGMAFPIVLEQPRTERAALLLPMSRKARVSGLEEDEARALTAQLWDIVEQSQFRWTAPSQSNDLILWDNLAAAHDNPSYPRGHARTSWFVNTIRDGEIKAHRLARESANA